MPPPSFLLEAELEAELFTLSSSSWLHGRDVHFMLQPPVCHRNTATACACHPSLPEHLLPATREKHACKSHPGLEKPWGASNWSPGRCKLPSPLAEPGSPELPSWPLVRDEPSRDLPLSIAEKLGQAGATGKADAGSSLSIDCSPHSASREKNFPEGPRLASRAQTQEAVCC